MAGVTITGTAIWFSDRDRIEPVDVYELLAGARERAVISVFGGSNISVYTNFYTHADMVDTTAQWLEYDDGDGTVATNLYVQPDGNLQQVSVVTTGVLGAASGTITELAPTGRKVLTWGWEEATVTANTPIGGTADNYIDDIVGTYTLDQSTGIMTNHNGLYVMQYSPTDRKQVISAQNVPGLDLTLGPSTVIDNATSHMLASDTWSWIVFQFDPFVIDAFTTTNAINVSVSTNISPRWVRDFDEVHKVPYRNAWQRLGARITKQNLDAIDETIAVLYGFHPSFVWEVFTQYPNATGLTSTSTVSEIIQAAHELRIFPPASFGPVFVMAPTGATTTLDEIYSRNWWKEFADRDYGTNTAHTWHYSPSDGYNPAITSGTWTNATYPRLDKSAITQRYDALRNLTHATVGSVVIASSTSLEWFGSSTNSLAEAISNAVSATPTNTTAHGSTPSRWSVTTSVFDGVSTTNHTAAFRAHQAQYAVTNLYVGIGKSAAVYSGVIPRGDFYSPEGYTTNGTMYLIADYAAIGTNSSYTFPSFGSLDAPTSTDFPATPGTKGWQLGSPNVDWSLDNTGPKSIIVWDFEYCITPLP